MTSNSNTSESVKGMTLLNSIPATPIPDKTYEVLRIIMDEGTLLRAEVIELIKELVEALGYNWLRRFFEMRGKHLFRVKKIVWQYGGLKRNNGHRKNRNRAWRARDHMTIGGRNNEEIILLSSDSE